MWTLCNLSAGTVVRLCTLCVFPELWWYLHVCRESAVWSPRVCFWFRLCLTCSMMRFLLLLLLGLCPCVVFVVMWSSLVCLWGCRATLCGCGVCCAVMRALLFVLHVCMLRECNVARLTSMLVWKMDEVWLWWVQGMWVVHVVRVLCLTQLMCYGWEELVECVRCVCVWLGAGWVEKGVSGWEDWVWALPILWEQGKCWTFVCFGCGGAGGVGG